MEKLKKREKTNSFPSMSIFNINIFRGGQPIFVSTKAKESTHRRNSWYHFDAWKPIDLIIEFEKIRQQKLISMPENRLKQRINAMRAWLRCG